MRVEAPTVHPHVDLVDTGVEVRDGRLDREGAAFDLSSQDATAVPSTVMASPGEVGGRGADREREPRERCDQQSPVTPHGRSTYAETLISGFARRTGYPKNLP